MKLKYLFRIGLCLSFFSGLSLLSETSYSSDRLPQNPASASIQKTNSTSTTSTSNFSNTTNATSTINTSITANTASTVNNINTANSSTSKSKLAKSLPHKNQVAENFIKVLHQADAVDREVWRIVLKQKRPEGRSLFGKLETALAVDIDPQLKVKGVFSCNRYSVSKQINTVLAIPQSGEVYEVCIKNQNEHVASYEIKSAQSYSVEFYPQNLSDALGITTSILNKKIKCDLESNSEQQLQKINCQNMASDRESNQVILWTQYIYQRNATQTLDLKGSIYEDLNITRKIELTVPAVGKISLVETQLVAPEGYVTAEKNHEIEKKINEQKALEQKNQEQQKKSVTPAYVLKNESANSPNVEKIPSESQADVNARTKNGRVPRPPPPADAVAPAQGPVDSDMLRAQQEQQLQQQELQPQELQQQQQGREILPANSQQQYQQASPENLQQQTEIRQAPEPQQDPVYNENPAGSITSPEDGGSSVQAPPVNPNSR